MQMNVQPGCNFLERTAWFDAVALAQAACEVYEEEDLQEYFQLGHPNDTRGPQCHGCSWSCKTEKHMFLWEAARK